MSLKQCINIWLLVLLGSLAQAQSVVTGKVLADGKPISEALVLLNPGALQAFTTPDGSYYFKQVKAGKYTIQAHAVGYQVFVKEITVSTTPTEVTIALSDLAIDLDAVTVQGYRESTGIGMARLASVDGVAI